MKKLWWVAVFLPLLLGAATGEREELDPEAYEKISQCVLVRERAGLSGQKVQLTGKFLGGSPFCHIIRKAGVNTRDYICFALGKPCILRLYLHKEHPQAELLRSLEDGDQVTAYGVFDYEGLDYNYLILDAIRVERNNANTSRRAGE